MQKYLTVTAITKYLKRKFDLDEHLRGVYIQGEISNFSHHSRGHMYFTLKDEHAKISAVMFASQNARLKFKPKDGMKVLVRGDISIYGPQGQYQIYIQDMQPDGIGSLHLAYEQLKEKLRLEGLFNTEHKKQLPTFPKKIAVLTSPTGAAIRDIVTTLERRYPLVDLIIIPILVQGKFSAKSIVEGIEKANKLTGIDTIILGRGGGSIEELWSFNEEIVARAIFVSEVPIISAVGHETDFTISDLVADVRAATPTGAAELAVPSRLDLSERVIQLNRMLEHSYQQQLKQANEKLQRIKQTTVFRFPKRFLEEKELLLDRIVEEHQQKTELFMKAKKDRWNLLHTQLQYVRPQLIIRQRRERWLQFDERLKNNIVRILQDKKIQFTNKLNQLELLDPTKIMRRGYSIAYSNEDEIIYQSEQLSINDEIKVKLSDGVIHANVTKIEEK